MAPVNKQNCATQLINDMCNGMFTKLFNLQEKHSEKIGEIKTDVAVIMERMEAIPKSIDMLAGAMNSYEGNINPVIRHNANMIAENKEEISGLKSQVDTIRGMAQAPKPTIKEVRTKWFDFKGYSIADITKCVLAIIGMIGLVALALAPHVGEFVSKGK